MYRIVQITGRMLELEMSGDLAADKAMIMQFVKERCVEREDLHRVLKLAAEIVSDEDERRHFEDGSF